MTGAGIYIGKILYREAFIKDESLCKGLPSKYKTLYKESPASGGCLPCSKASAKGPRWKIFLSELQCRVIFWTNGAQSTYCMGGKCSSISPESPSDAEIYSVVGPDTPVSPMQYYIQMSTVI